MLLKGRAGTMIREPNVSADGHRLLHTVFSVLVGRDTVAYVHNRRAQRRQRPLDTVSGESRWEAVESDAPDPGPYAMLDERAAKLLTGPDYCKALAELPSSIEAQPVLGDSANTDMAPDVWSPEGLSR
jgi:hypothetical protein